MPTGQVYGNGDVRTVTMDSDLSAKEMFAVNMDATDDDNVNLAADASAIPFVLIDGEDGSSAKADGSIALSGRTKVKLGGTVAPGDKLTADSVGKWIATVTDTDHYGAIAMQIGVANDVIEAKISQGTVAG